MNLEKSLQQRANSQCELCGSTTDLAPFLVAPRTDKQADSHIYACVSCRSQLDDPSTANPNHWRCLNDSMWSEVPAVQVTAYRMLHQLKHEGWPADLLDMLYLDEDTKAWAEDGLPDENAIQHIDSNGNVLQAGDTVVLIQDLKVKGSSLVAKRGTAVRRISLDHDNAGYIEGRVDGQHIVILTKYVKKVK